MRVFANLFLLLFLADGGFSLIDELIPLISPLTSFTPLRSLLAGTVVVMAAALYLCLGIDRRLPKRIFLPQTLFVLCCPFSTWLFPALAEVRTYGLIAAIVQVSLGMLPLYYCESAGEQCLKLPAERFAVPFFSLKNSLIFTGVNLLIAPFVLILLLLFTANAYMAAYTADFMRLDPGGLRMVERVYKRADQTIRLAAMIHVGTKEFYDELTASIPPGRSIVLAEGVSDDEQLLTGSIDYGKTAGYLGLTSQEQMHFSGRYIEPEEFEASRLGSREAKDGKRPLEVDILRADVDVSELRPATILFLNALGKQLQGSESLLKDFLALNSWGKSNVTPENYDLIIDDVLHRRNMTVISYLDTALKRYDTVVIPWGALHMKEIETEVQRRGFTLQNERERVSIDFRKLLLTLF